VVAAAPIVQPIVQQQQQPAPVKMDETSNGSKSYSEEDLMRLKKINFKRKISGKIHHSNRLLWQAPHNCVLFP